MFRRSLLVLGLAVAFSVTGLRWAGSPEISADPVPAPELPTGLVDRLDALEAANQELRGELEALRTQVSGEPTAELSILDRYPVPDEVVLCGERLPLERDDVFRRFEEEWSRYLVNQHWMLKWQTRARDVFPYVEARMADAGLPDDLKYVLVVESGLEPRAYSSAGAAGWWQFIGATGKRYGLHRTNSIDERRDLGLATTAAIRYFQKLHEEFGSWPLALAAYNAGEKRIRDERKAQGEEDYYDLSLPRETEAYWFRAAVIKELFEHADRYGMAVADSGPVATVCDTLQLKVTRSRLELREIATRAGITYREFRELNPAFRRRWVGKGTHRVILPHDHIDHLVDDLKGVQVALRQRAGRFLAVGEETKPTGHAGPARDAEPAAAAELRRP